MKVERLGLRTKGDFQGGGGGGLPSLLEKGPGIYIRKREIL